jgi:AhpD family alkylhydroperoxidase
MSRRKLLRDADPQAFNIMMGFDSYLATSSLTKTHWELIKIRVSQINGCAYCIDKHSRDALKLGESAQRIYLLSVWRETDFFSAEEEAILALAEDITLIARKGVSDKVYDNALDLLGQKYLTEVMMAIIAMNAWNRVGITTERKPDLQNNLL